MGPLMALDEPLSLDLVVIPSGEKLSPEPLSGGRLVIETPRGSPIEFFKLTDDGFDCVKSGPS